MPASYATHRSQLELILRAWGMPQATAASTAEIMSWADLHGVDTHGISMVPPYDERRRAGKIDMRAEPTVARQTPVSVFAMRRSCSLKAAGSPSGSRAGKSLSKTNTFLYGGLTCPVERVLPGHI